QFRCQLGKPIVSTFRPAERYVRILTLNIAGLAQSLTESDEGRFVRASRGAGKETDYRHRRLLRARRDRPRGCRAAEQRDELAAFLSIPSSARSRIAVDSPMPIALGLQVYHQFELCRLLDGQIGGLGAACYPINKLGDAHELRNETRPV